MTQAIYSLYGGDDRCCIPKHAVDILLSHQCDKTTLLSGLASACHFPAYFAYNWDSAWDCLIDSEVSALRLDLTATQFVNCQDLAAFECMIEDAYKDFGKPQLWIVRSAKAN